MKKRIAVIFLAIIVSLVFGCASTRVIPEIPVDPEVNGWQGRPVTLFKNKNGGYIISFQEINFASKEGEKLAEMITGLEKEGEYFMVYSTKTETFSLLTK